MSHISVVERRKCPFVVVDLAEFTDEEGYGKYLDLHECYEKFINLKGIEVEWLQKLMIFMIKHAFRYRYSISVKQTEVSDFRRV